MGLREAIEGHYDELRQAREREEAARRAEFATESAEVPDPFRPGQTCPAWAAGTDPRLRTHKAFELALTPKENHGEDEDD